jgi:hypothetical protein
MAEHLADRRHRQPADLDHRAHQPQPAQVLLVVLGGGRVDLAAGAQQAFAQVVLDRRDGHTAALAQLGQPHVLRPSSGTGTIQARVIG